MKKFKTKTGTELIISDIQGRDYMQVAQRLIWFREEHPDWSIETAIVMRGEDHAVLLATIKDETGRLMATSHKAEDKKEFFDYVEKAETGAIGRALALVGYGTQFAGHELDEGNRLADSPQGVPSPRQASVSGARCALCGEELILSKSGQGYYCPNFKDITQGEHSRCKKDALFAYIAEYKTHHEGKEE